MTVFRMVTAALLPVALTAAFCLLEGKTRFGKFSYWVRQIVIGVAFGVLACLATSFGINYAGAVINVRSAAPLTAGLLFGGPAGLISGLIGAVHRYAYTELACLQTLYSGTGAYTQTACTIATAQAGLIGALCRKYIFDNRKAGWLQALIIGVFTEGFHMILVFITNIGDLHTAFEVVTMASPPMIIVNSLSVTAACLAASLLSREKLFRLRGAKRLSQIFQTGLVICVLIAFVSTIHFTTTLQDNIAETDAENLLKLNVNAIPTAIESSAETGIVQYASVLASGYYGAASGDAGADQALLERLMQQLGFHEVHILDNAMQIVHSSIPAVIGQSILSYPAFSALEELPAGGSYLMRYGPSPFEAGQERKYVALKMQEGVVLVGYLEQFLATQIEANARIASHNRYVGETGYVLLADDQGVIISSNRGTEGETLAEAGISLAGTERGSMFAANVYGEDCFCLCVTYPSLAGDFDIIAVCPQEEAFFSKDVSIQLSTLMELLVYAVLFASIFVMVKRVVVDKIHDVNASLEQITRGNLDVRVEVGGNEEFVALSEDINATVDTLKKYIAEAASRIDQELEYARQIQMSALPSVFPQRNDFSIYATMHAAREVGGDFYDFYLLGENRLAIVIADVSGKGIPAAMFMMIAKTMLKGFAENGLPVNEVFTQANAKLCEGNEAGMFVTAWMGIVNLETGEMTYANAGHNPPVIRRKDGSYEYLRTRPNFVLAGMEGVRYKLNELLLQPGDEIFLYTDGVTEAQNAASELYEEARLLSCLKGQKGCSVEEICRHVKADVDAFVGGADQFDDITMLCVRLSE